MTTPPTLTEMRHAVGEVDSEIIPPTFDEMAHANMLYQMDQDAYLEHYGVKGMKWGVRRSRELLARAAGRTKAAAIGTKDEEGNVVGGIRAASRAGAQKLKDMRPGSTLILEDAEGASKIMAKQKDGTFKEVYLSADAERVLRTTKKDQSELSDKEINDAINRAKKIEEYNKLFNPQPNPNADLEARVAAMRLEIALRDAQRQLNPPKKKMVNRFVDTVSGGFGAYQQANKATNGLVDKTLKQMIEELRDSRTQQQTSAAGTAAAAAASAARKTRKKSSSDGPSMPTTTSRPTNLNSEEQKRVDDFIYNITTMGNDPSNPFYNPTTPISPAPTYLELGRSS